MLLGSQLGIRRQKVFHRFRHLRRGDDFGGVKKPKGWQEKHRKTMVQWEFMGFTLWLCKNNVMLVYQRAMEKKTSPSEFPALFDAC